jgi:pseudouridine-5'-phosphate glycosidase
VVGLVSSKGSRRTPASLRERLVVAPEVSAALREGRPVVALESTLISHGLPWPRNLEVALAAETAVRSRAATPATIAIRRGRIMIGLDRGDIEALATASPGTVMKAARPTLARALLVSAESSEWAATTVSATMIAAHAAGIDVFATGGLGGVHRGALAAIGGGVLATATEAGDLQPSFDISSDLDELARTPMVVVCAGPKAILDVRATIEYLETRGVPVVAVGQEDVPGFYARSSGLPAPASVQTTEDAAQLARVHLGLELGTAILVCVPVPERDAVPPGVVREAVDCAIAEAARGGVAGASLTPWLLSRIAELTDGASVRANVSLIVNNAATAARIATALSSPSATS